MRLRSVSLLLLFLFACLCSSAAFAQVETGRVTGLVLDQQGAVVPGATITLTSTDTGAVRVTTSGPEGRFAITNLPPGPYTAKIELSGFTGQTANMVVNVGGTVTLETTLRVAGAAEAVSVVAESPLINIANPEVAVTVREEQIRELPTLTRDVFDLVRLSGNVTEAQPEEAENIGTARGTGYSINGARTASTNILLDGAANNDEFVAGVGQNVPLDAVQEFSVVSNNFSAQYGRATGGIVNAITKSGSNTFRGTAYEFYRNDNLSSNSVDNRANHIEKGDFSRHQPGYSFGGPIIRDKLHFFSSLEYIRVRSADTEISWVPTPQFLAATGAATQAFFNAYGKGATINGPTLTRGDVSSIVGTGAGAFNALAASLPVFGRVEKSLPIDAGGGDPRNEYQFVGRVDWALNSNTQAYGRYAYQSVVAEAGTNVSSPYSGFDTGYVNKNHSILGSVTHVFSSNLTSQTKMVYNRLLEDQPLNGPNVPTLFMNTGGPVRLQGYRIAFPGYGPWSPGNAIPFGGPQKFLQLYQDQTWLWRSHDFRFGGTFVRISDDRTFGAYANSPEFLNTTSNALVSLNNLVTGNIARFQTAINPEGLPGGTYVTPVQLPSFTSKNRYNEFAIYAQDNWSIRNRVKVNLGVRYEYFGPQEKSEPKYDSNFYYASPDASVSTLSAQQLIDTIRAGQVLPSNQSPTGTLWKSDRNNFAPRIGAAWDVTGDGKTSVRGGYGMAYERNFGNVTYNVLFNPPQYLVATLDAGTDVVSLPIFTDLAGPFGGIAGVRKTIPGGSLRHVDQNIVTAYTHQYGASMQREVMTGLTASIEYNGSTGRKLYDLADPNRRGSPLVYQGIGTASTRPNTRFTAFNTRGNRGRSQYHGLTFSGNAREIGMTGLLLTSRYTLGWAKDNLSSTFSDGNNGYFNLGYLDGFNSEPNTSGRECGTSTDATCGPMLDWGYAEFDVRHRLSVSAVWNVPVFQSGSGLKQTLLGGWALNGIFTARSGYPFSVFDCSFGRDFCPRAIDTANISKSADGDTATGNPNEYTVLDLAPIMGAAGSYVNALTGTSDYGPYPSNMTRRNAFRGQGAWFVDLGISKRFRFAGGRAAQVRVEAFNLFDHANMFVHTDIADVSSFSTLTGYKDGHRQIQLGFKFEF